MTDAKQEPVLVVDIVFKKLYEKYGIAFPKEELLKDKSIRFVGMIINGSKKAHRIYSVSSGRNPIIMSAAEVKKEIRAIEKIAAECEYSADYINLFTNDKKYSFDKNTTFMPLELCPPLFESIKTLLEKMKEQPQENKDSDSDEHECDDECDRINSGARIAALIAMMLASSGTSNNESSESTSTGNQPADKPSGTEEIVKK